MDKSCIYSTSINMPSAAARQIRTSLYMDGDTALYCAQRPDHSARAAAQFSLKFGLEVKLRSELNRL